MRDRRRRRHQLRAPAQNLDSFLDILTNTVGVLTFVGLFVSLVAVEASNVVRTPLASETEKVPQHFEVRGDRITHIDLDAVEREVERFNAALPDCIEPSLSVENGTNLDRFERQQLNAYLECVRIRTERRQNWRFETEHYQVYLGGGDRGGWTFLPLRGMRGESGTEIARERSQFRTFLGQLDPETEYLGFVVRPDGFKTFRKAREIAWEAGFDVGWVPINASNAISFNFTGRGIGVQ